jgi:hypothetical protein
MAEHPDHPDVANSGDVVLDQHQAWVVRDMLLTGLACYGELERLINAAEVYGERVPELMRPIDPVGDAEGISKFAAALQALQPRCPD